MPGADQSRNDVVPCPDIDAGIAAGDAGFGNLKVDRRLASSVVFRFDDSLRFILVRGGETGALPGPGIDAVKSTARVPQELQW